MIEDPKQEAAVWTVECSICNALVPEDETCRTGACRECHKSNTFEECLREGELIAKHGLGVSLLLGGDR